MTLRVVLFAADTDEWLKAVMSYGLPVLIVCVVVLGVVLAFAYKGIQFGENSWLVLAKRREDTEEFAAKIIGILEKRWVGTDGFAVSINRLRAPREDEFRRIIERADEQSIKDHDRDGTAHREIRHYFLSEIQGLKDADNRIIFRIEKLESRDK